jgi:hypothetical protein
VALRAGSRAAVDRFHAAGLKAGAQDNGAPGLRTGLRAGLLRGVPARRGGQQRRGGVHAPTQVRVVQCARAGLVERFGGRNWRKCKGVAPVEAEGNSGLAEIHWYECHGIGKVKMKVKRWL